MWRSLLLLLKVFDASGIGGHGDRLKKIFGSHKWCWDSQWPLADCYFKCWIHRDDCNKQNIPGIKVWQPIQRSKPLINKPPEHSSSIYYGIQPFIIFLMFFISCYSLILGFSWHFLINISGDTYNKFQGIFYISHINFCYF